MSLFSHGHNTGQHILDEAQHILYRVVSISLSLWSGLHKPSVLTPDFPSKLLLHNGHIALDQYTNVFFLNWLLENSSTWGITPHCIVEPRLFYAATRAPMIIQEGDNPPSGTTLPSQQSYLQDNCTWQNYPKKATIIPLGQSYPYPWDNLTFLSWL